MENAHRSSAIRSWITHDDALRDAQNLIVLPIRRRVEKVIGGLLERCKHQHAVLHFCNTEAGDTEDLALLSI